ncbi:MAG TPA: BamA/TamA family outer membrane protein [Cyclobacteriaceae bacterium]
MVRVTVLVTLVFCLAGPQGFSQVADSVPQVDIVELIIKKFNINLKGKSRDNRKVHFSLFPTESAVPGGGRAVVTSFNAAFYLGEKSDTRVSTVYFVPYITLVGKYGFLVRPSIWLSRNSWNLNGDYRILKYPQYTWGVEGVSDNTVKTVVDYSYLRIYQTAIKTITTNWGLGIGYMLDYHDGISEEIPEGTEGHLASYFPGEQSRTTSAGFVFPIAYDSRLNAINPERGSFLLINYRFNTPLIGSDHQWQSLYVDGRKYFPFSKHKHNLLALRGYYWTVLSGQVPYLDLPSIGWDITLNPSGRGIQQGRYRSNALLYFESEYRVDLTHNGLFGAVVFTNVTSASVYDTQKFQSWHPAVGTGLRVKFNKYSRTNVALDFAFSKDYTTVYLRIGEAF